MTQLPSEYPVLAIHLSDKDLTPIITSSSSTSTLDSLTALTSSALSAKRIGHRARLGRLQRIMVEYPDAGTVILETYLDAPPAPPGGAKPPDELALARLRLQRQRQKQKKGGVGVGDDDEDDMGPPALVGLVVARPDDVHEATQAVVRVEDVARQFQAEWAAELEKDPTFGLDDA
ncbi:hypothetical protein E4U42_007678 [Claviceps africana]|uniref:Uncharacterized protein n=1 Tax=Claviceps africana TaxID=83212 RepID=A0A8K0J3L0_9HYPO|nr:hypothetical protein E4U42_007678 [Claviceps africana]